MAEKISDKNKVENISTGIVLEKEQKALSSSYIKSYSHTKIESTIFDYTWKIDKFMHLSKIKNTIQSPWFPETGQYMIQANILYNDDSINLIQFYMITNKTFNGLCTTTVSSLRTMSVSPEPISSKVVSSCITNKTLLIEIPKPINSSFYYIDTLIIHCKFEIFDVINDTISMNLLTSSLEFKDVKSLVNSTFESKDKKSIKFIVGKGQYNISKKLLCAINSKYFNEICLTHEGKEKNMTNELTYEELNIFEQILIFILTNSVNHCNYDTLKKLLTMTDKYDVPTLKLTCEHHLLRYITVENAMELAQLAFSSNAKFLETHSTIFIKFHGKEIMNTFKNKKFLN